MRLIDQKAAAEGLSRSETVDRVLASALQHETPEMGMRSLWDTVGELLGGGELRFSNLTTPSMAWAEGTLSYPYRPTVRYSVELTPEAPYLGVLRVGLRSRSAALWQALERFFALWAALEGEYQGKDLWRREGERFCRVLLRSSWDRDEQGRELSRYLNGLNRAINLYFTQGESALRWEYEREMTRLSI